MRRKFADAIHKLMATDDRIVIITADLGYKLWDQVAKDYPTKFFNVGASEHLAVGIALGFLYSGKIPIVYSITPFLLERCYEQIRIYLEDTWENNGSIFLVGSGLNEDYSHDGPTHWFKNISLYFDRFFTFDYVIPVEETSLEEWIPKWINEKKPLFIGLRR